ncbi:hypothetical protein ACXO9W_03615 [Lactobacillus delbrueckii subsp. bulgaricus]
MDLNEDGNWHPFGYQNFVELLDDPDAPCELFNKIYLRGGAKSMAWPSSGASSARKA